MNVVKPESEPVIYRQAIVLARWNILLVCWVAVTRGMQVCKKPIGVALLLSVLWPMPCQAKDIDLVVDVESPQVLALLEEASTLERSADDPYKIRRAILLYCQAARFGSPEAQFRFGMFYFSGKSVPKNLDFASALFSQAAQQGHSQAMSMLERVKFRHLELPPCLS